MGKVSTLSSLILRKLPRDVIKLRSIAQLFQSFFFLGVFLALYISISIVLQPGLCFSHYHPRQALNIQEYAEH